jgi:hypothetical protein
MEPRSGMNFSETHGFPIPSSTGDLQFSRPHSSSIQINPWSQDRGSNPRPPPYHGGALPTELSWQILNAGFIVLHKNFFFKQKTRGSPGFFV